MFTDRSHLQSRMFAAFAAEMRIPMKDIFFVFPALILIMAVAVSNAESERKPDGFVWPGHGSPKDRPVWGHRDGLRIGIKPTRGPAGLIRVYAPYLGQEYPRVVNFLSIEPLVKGQTARGQSELEMSRDRPGQRGLTFWGSNSILPDGRPNEVVSGELLDGEKTLRLFIHTEPFRNGAQPVIECRFHHDQPCELELVTHAAAESAPLLRCTISATMGNYGLLRRIHLKDDRIASAPALWKDEPLGAMGFYRWRSWPADQLERTPDGRFFVRLSTDVPDPGAVEHDPDVKPHWRYVGQKAVHYWRTEADANASAAVNGRLTYWMSQSRIPGGAAFENFELAMPFKPGRRLWFGVRPDRDQER
jgi:hypothetical protein